MINKKEFQLIEKELGKREKERETSIQNSALIIRLSKKIIYAVHRDDFKEASKQIVNIIKEVKKLKLRSDTGMPNVAYQEFVEAYMFYHLIKNKKFQSYKSFPLKLDIEHYLLGICDLTGEIVRKAVNLAIKEKYAQVLWLKELTEEIFWAFSTFDLRNSELRKKSDQLRWNLKKLEDISLEIKLKDKI